MAHKPQLERFLENNALPNIAQRFTNFKLADRILNILGQQLLSLRLHKYNLSSIFWEIKNPETLRLILI